MSVVELKGDMFTSDAPALAHGVNCHGVMGAGVAKIMREKYPVMHSAYREVCRFEHLLPGMQWPWLDTESHVMIYNVASQDLPGSDARVHWLKRGLTQMYKHMEGRKIDRVAMPEIGCGIGGLQRPAFYETLLELEGKFPEITTEVWVYG